MAHQLLCKNSGPDLFGIGQGDADEIGRAFISRARRGRHNLQAAAALLQQRRRSMPKNQPIRTMTRTPSRRNRHGSPASSAPILDVRLPRRPAIAFALSRWSRLTKKPERAHRVPSAGGDHAQTLYDWTLHLADTRHAMWRSRLCPSSKVRSFDSADVLMIPMIVARPSRAWAIAGVALVASVLGGLLGYASGPACSKPSVGLYSSSTARTRSSTNSAPDTTSGAHGPS